MKQFRISYPVSMVRALTELAEAPEDQIVKVIAGGQDLLGEMKEHIVEPDYLINLTMIEAMRGLRARGGGGMVSVIGPMVTLSRLVEDEGIREHLPMIAEAASSVGTPQIRNVGTVGGNLCQRPRCWYYRNEHAVCLKKGGSVCFAFSGRNKYNAVLGGGPDYIVHPSDLAPALIAYDATISIHPKEEGAPGMKRMPLEEFFTLPSEGDVTKENVLARNELLASVMVPDRAGWRATYLKVHERGSFDFALSSVALALRMGGEEIAEARLVLGGVAPKPWRCRSTEELLVGRAIDDETCKLAGKDALRGARPLQENAYKIPMTKGLITKALRKLAGQE